MVRVSLAPRPKTKNCDQKLAPTISGSNKPVLLNVKLRQAKYAFSSNSIVRLLATAHAAANNQGITRTAWLDRAAFDALEDRVESPPG